MIRMIKFEAPIIQKSKRCKVVLFFPIIKSMKVLASLILSVFFLTAAFAYTPESGSKAELAVKSGWATVPDPHLPNVLILGDSISIGYTLQVKALLKGKANVFRPNRRSQPENCQGTTNSLVNIDRWLSGQKWDVIHFNWGLHDLKRVKILENGKMVNSTESSDPYQATVEQYRENLAQLVAKLKATNAKLIFATTTPVVADSAGPLREVDGPIRYNTVALEVMKANGIQVNDLYTFCLPKLDQWQLPKNVHFNRQGSAALAKEVAAEIESELP